MIIFITLTLFCWLIGELDERRSRQKLGPF